MLEANDVKRVWRENNVRSDDDTIWNKEAEPVLEGALTKIEHNVGPNESTLYTVKKDDGAEVKIWGSTVLDDRFLGVPEGSYVKVTYEGLKQGKAGKSYHNYKVYIDEGAAPQTSGYDQAKATAQKLSGTTAPSLEPLPDEPPEGLFDKPE